MFHCNVAPSIVIYLLFCYTYKVQNCGRYNRAKMDLTVAVQFDGSWLIIIKPINEEKYSIKPYFLTMSNERTTYIIEYMRMVQI
jgi:hypothetical protein